MRSRPPMSETKPWERILVGSFAGALAAATVLTFVVICLAFVGYDAFDSFGSNTVRFLFVLAPIIAGVVGAIVGAFWPDLVVRALGRLWDSIVRLLQCI